MTEEEIEQMLREADPVKHIRPSYPTPEESARLAALARRRRRWQPVWTSEAIEKMLAWLREDR